MAYQISDKAKAIHERLEVFMEQHIYPREKDFDEFTSNQENLWQYPDWYRRPKKRSKETRALELILTQRICSLEPWLNQR